MGRAKTVLWPEREAQRAGSVVHLIRVYVSDLEVRQVSAATQRSAEGILWRFWQWCDLRSLLDVEFVTLRHVEAYQRHLYTHRKANGEPLAITTQIHELTRLRLFFAWATRKHYIAANPAADIVLPRPIHRVPDYLTHAEIAQIFAQPDIHTPIGLRDRAMLEMLYSTGMRRLELSNLCQGDLEPTAKLIRIVQSKGRKDRIIPMGARAWSWLDKYQKEARPLLLAGAIDATAPTAQRVFLSNRRGVPLHRDAIGTTVKNYLYAAGITKKGSCHLFRHTAATHLLENGCDVRVIQELLGHENLDTTAGYTRVAITHLQKAHAAYHPAEQVPGAPPAE